VNLTATAVPASAALRSASVQGMIQRCGGISCPPGTCDHPDDAAEAVHRSAEPGTAAATSPVPASILRVLDTSGSPLGTSVRVAMEAHLGHHFGRVRVHTDVEAARSAAAIQAHPYTFGSHVVMGAGRFQPHTAAGRRLRAHEMTHVVQQAGMSGSAPRSATRVILPSRRRRTRPGGRLSGQILALTPINAGSREVYFRGEHHAP
jgi:hypothetical protein